MTVTGTLAGLGYAAASLITTLGKQSVSNPWFVLSVAAAIISTLAFIAASLTAVPGWVRPAMERRHKAAPLVVNRWLYTTDGSKTPATRIAMDISLRGTAASGKLQDGQPPWIRVTITMACSEIDTDADPELTYLNFRATLEEPLASRMISDLTTVPQYASWQLSSASPGIIEACLGNYEHADQAVAAARLELPCGVPRYGRDGRCATMILHIELHDPASAKLPEFWTGFIERALWLPTSLAKLLESLELSTSGEPPAQLGVMLQSPVDLADLVDITFLHPIRGSQGRASQAIGFFIADPNGRSAEQSAQLMIRDMLLYSLKTTAV